MEYQKTLITEKRDVKNVRNNPFLLFLSVLLLLWMVAGVATAQEIIRTDFEDGTTQDWAPRGGSVILEVVSDAAYSGSNSLKVTGRTSGWHGASLDLMSIIEVGAVYQFTAYARMVDGQPAASLNMTIQQTPVGGSTAWDWVTSASVDTDWVMLQGEYTLAAAVSDIVVYIESSDATAEYYIDDFSLILLIPAPPEEPEEPSGLVVENDFEDGTTQGWSPRGGSVVLEVSTEAAYNGNAGLKVTGRTSGWHGASLDLSSLVLPGAVYEFTAYAKLVEGQAATNLTMTVQRSDSEGNTYYEWVDSASADAAWVELKGSYTFTDGGNGLLVYIEAQEATAEYYIDDFSILMTSPPPPDQSGITSDFEDGTTQGWSSRIGVEVLEATSLDAHDGLYSLQTTGREHTYGGPSLDILGKMHRSSRYFISVWAKLLPGEADCNLRVSIQRSSGGVTNYDTIVSDTPVTGNDWVQLTSTYILVAEVDTLSIYVEADSATAAFYIDDFVLSYIEPKPVQTDIPSLKEELTGYFPIGAAVKPSDTITAHSELLKIHFASVTAENVMKPYALQGEEGVFTFNNADTIVNFARENGMLIRGHTLIWHDQTPAWFFQDTDGNDLEATPENRELMIQRMESHITTVVDHFKDDVFAWDVVNEVIDASQPDYLRRSRWYELIGPEYIDLAFQFARAADPDAMLYINDYSTVSDTAKRNALYKVVSGMLNRGVPVDGVGHQMHINIASPPAISIRQTIELFASLGMDNQITEMDMSIYENDSDSYTTVPEEILIEQGYRYKEVFDELKRLKDHISSVTMWGIADDSTWLSSFPINRLNLPLLFDEELQAKYAYWGVVDPGQLPLLMNEQEIPRGKARVDSKEDLRWEIMPWIPVRPEGLRTGAFKAMWDDNTLYVLAEVSDPGINRKADLIEIFLDLNNGKTTTYEDDDLALTFTRGRTGHTRRGRTRQNKIKWKTSEIEGGYRFEMALPIETGLVMGQEIGFDLRCTDAENPGDVLIWNDLTGSQDTDTSKFGTLIPGKQIDVTIAHRVFAGSIVIDGYDEAAWDKAHEIETGTWILGEDGATARVKTLWSKEDSTLYILARVTDPLLSDASGNAWEQDSIEIFIDQNNGKTGYYEADDGQYRINFNNVQSFGGNAVADVIDSAVSITGCGYLVELSIVLDKLTDDACFIGFDIQVNDDGAGDGVRSGFVTWSDPLGTAYRNTENFGVLFFPGRSNKHFPPGMGHCVK